MKVVKLHSAKSLKLFFCIIGLCSRSRAKEAQVPHIEDLLMTWSKFSGPIQLIDIFIPHFLFLKWIKVWLISSENKTKRSARSKDNFEKRESYKWERERDIEKTKAYPLPAFHSFLSFEADLLCRNLIQWLESCGKIFQDTKKIVN